MELPTPERLRQLLDYGPETGLLRWRPRTARTAGSASMAAHWNRRYAGKVAGTAHRDGTIAVKIFNRILLGHRVAWAIAHDEWAECVFHRNGDAGDNRLHNLCATSRDELAEQLAAERKHAMQAA